MLKSLKIWWLQKQLEMQVEDLAMARKYLSEETRLMEHTIAQMEVRKQKTYLQLLTLKESADQETAEVETA